LRDELARYDAVIHLRTPTAEAGYNHQNPLRRESPAEAAAIDVRIAAAWADHPRRYEVAATPDFLSKAARAIEILRAEIPAGVSWLPVPRPSPVRRAERLEWRGLRL